MASVAFQVTAVALAFAAVCVAPGYLWARALVPARDPNTRFAFAVGLSLALVPACAVLLTRTLAQSVTLTVAVLAPCLVLAAGLAANLFFGEAKVGKGRGCEDPDDPGGADDASLPPGFESRRSWSRLARGLLFPVVLGLVLCRYYLGVVLHDWPYLRGGDLYSHAVMANRMMEAGQVLPYLVYPPGFHTVTTILARVTGLDPLEIFPVLVPALMALPALALYALASRLWGRAYGVAAAAISGLLLGSTYGYFEDAMYPNMVSAQFLLPMTVCALVLLYAHPAPRAALLLALLGSSVVLYHPVGSLYTAALLAAVALFAVPYSVLRGRREGLALAASLVLLGVLAVAYAWETYDIPGAVAGLVSGSEAGSGGYAVASAIGTQAPLPLEHFLSTLTAPVVLFGLLGAGLLLVRRTDETPDLLDRVTLLAWATILFVGSRTSLSGFPERFERDLGVPLALLAAFALLVSVEWLRRPGRGSKTALAAASAALIVALFGAQLAHNLQHALREPTKFLMTPGISEAGAWLRESNEGGNIIVGPHQNQVPSRAMLAMGDYSALQSFTPSRIVYDRDLPPHGPEPMWDVLYAVENPASPRTAEILEEYDVRYIVFYKRFAPGTTWGSTTPGGWWREYQNLPELYAPAFENESVAIFEPKAGE